MSKPASLDPPTVFGTYRASTVHLHQANGLVHDPLQITTGIFERVDEGGTVLADLPDYCEECTSSTPSVVLQ